MRPSYADSVLFKDMSEEELKICLKEMRTTAKSYDKDAVILHAGDPTKKMGIVLEGSVRIENNDLWGSRSILSHIGPGGFFAETYALLPDAVMLVDVVANEKCRVMFLRVSGLLENAPATSWRNILTRNLLLISSHKNLALSGRSFHTSPKSARGRLLSYLNMMAIQQHADEFDIPFNRQQLADYLNLERTNMSKELTRMKRDGLIRCRKNHFKLLPSAHQDR